MSTEKLSVKTLGSDPEFLIKNLDTDKFVSSLNLIPGDKNSPVSLDDLGKGYSIQKDNVLAELCVPPALSGDELYNSIQKAVDYIHSNILPSNYKLVAVTGGEFAKEDVNTEFARTFGCSSSYNAWTYSTNNIELIDRNYRGAGCHFHVGYDNFTIEKSVEIVRMFDLFGGVPAVLYDRDTDRRKQYGTAGEFRPTEYGLELRIMGGLTLSTKERFDAAIKGIYRAFDAVNQGLELLDETQLKIQECINESDLKLAHELIEEFELEELVEKQELVIN